MAVEESSDCVSGSHTQNSVVLLLASHSLCRFVPLLLDGLPYEIAEAAICNDVHSCNHTDCIRVYYNRLTDTMKLAAKLSLPRTKGVSICRPGWNLTLKQSKAIAQNAYQRWKREGKPRHGMYHWAMCESRNDFKREMTSSRK